jgi:hypothetical protein
MFYAFCCGFVILNVLLVDVFGGTVRHRLFTFKSFDSLYGIFVLGHVAVMIKVNKDILISQNKEGIYRIRKHRARLLKIRYKYKFLISYKMHVYSIFYEYVLHKTKIYIVMI